MNHIEKMATAIAKELGMHITIDTAQAAFDALMLALPDLVWVDDEHGSFCAGPYKIDSRFRYVVTFQGVVLNPNGEFSMDAAKAIANAHRREQARNMWPDGGGL